MPTSPAWLHRFTAPTSRNDFLARADRQRSSRAEKAGKTSYLPGREGIVAPSLTLTRHIPG